MLAKTNAIFLAKRSYVKTDKETNEKTNMRCYDFLIFEDVVNCGMVKPELKSYIVNADETNEVAESLNFFDNFFPSSSFSCSERRDNCLYCANK